VLADGKGVSSTELDKICIDATSFDTTKGDMLWSEARRLEVVVSLQLTSLIDK